MDIQRLPCFWYATMQPKGFCHHSSSNMQVINHNLGTSPFIVTLKTQLIIALCLVVLFLLCNLNSLFYHFYHGQSITSFYVFSKPWTLLVSFVVQTSYCMLRAWVYRAYSEVKKLKKNNFCQLNFQHAFPSLSQCELLRVDLLQWDKKKHI